MENEDFARLTPEEVNTKRFTPVRGGREGYDMEEVDTFLDSVEDTINDYDNSENGLRVQLAAVGQEKAALEQNLQELKVRFQEAIEHAERETRTAVQAEAKVVIDQLQAKNQALESDLERVKAEANGHIEELERELAEARSATAPVVPETDMVGLLESVAPAEEALPDFAIEEPQPVPATPAAASQPTVIEVRTLPEASTAAAKLLESATLTAENIKAEATAEADSIKAEAEARREEVLATIETERVELEGKVSDLRTFNKQIREDLNSYVENLKVAIAEPVEGLDEDAAEDEATDEA